jgi:Leucine-rich repeat (LRR) protein
MLRLAVLTLAAAACFGAADPAAWVSDAGGIVTRDGQGRITAIDLRGSWVTDSDLAELARLPDLQRLNLSLTRIGDHGMQQLKNAPAIVDLDVSFDEWITDSGLAAIKGWRHLKRLNLRGTKITDMTVQYLSAVTSIEWLDIAYTQLTDVGLDPLTALVNLKELSIGGNKLTDAGLQPLRQLSSLTSLDLSGGQRTDSGIWTVSLTEPGLDALGTLSNLRHLRLSGTLVSSRSLGKLKGLTKLERLDLDGCKRIGDDAVPALATLAALHLVDLNSTSFTARGFEALRQAKPDCSVLTGNLDASHRDAVEEHL